MDQFVNFFFHPHDRCANMSSDFSVSPFSVRKIVNLLNVWTTLKTFNYIPHPDGGKQKTISHSPNDPLKSNRMLHKASSCVSNTLYRPSLSLIIYNSRLACSKWAWIKTFWRICAFRHFANCLLIPCCLSRCKST